LTKFSDLGLAAPILQALEDEGYEVPTPIQVKAIPIVLAGGDLLGIAQAGTGKTAAFALPIIQRLMTERRPAMRKGCRALVLAPTRELSTQIAQSFRTYGRHVGLSVAGVFGGVGHRLQAQALARGLDVLVATPDLRVSRVRALVATDIAARGIDIDQLTHVVNYEPCRTSRRDTSTALAARPAPALGAPPSRCAMAMSVVSFGRSSASSGSRSQPRTGAIQRIASPTARGPYPTAPARRPRPLGRPWQTNAASDSTQVRRFGSYKAS
jgi:hypothetical protein